MRIAIFIVGSLIWAFIVPYAGKHIESENWFAVVTVPLCGIPTLLFMLDEANKPKSMYDTFVTLFQGVACMMIVGMAACGMAVLILAALDYIRKW